MKTRRAPKDPAPQKLSSTIRPSRPEYGSNIIPISAPRRWRRRILNHPCPSCHADIDQPCRFEIPDIAREFHVTREYIAKKGPLMPDPIAGQFISTKLYDRDTDTHTLRIDRADQHVAIDPNLIADIATRPTDNAWLEYTPNGTLLHIKGVNREVIYRIGQLRPSSYSYNVVYEGHLMHTPVPVAKFLGP